MALNIGDTLHGFTVTRVREVPELSGAMVEMVYDKTGTELIWIDNGVDNKLFSIAFKTIPEDSTGVFHILEHTVLNGSDKYPVKEPFVELLKSSMNTFLNAMTFPDKTMYPVSSRNKADFMNLTSVYLDAVFHPMIDRNPNIFRQEGWHIELKDKDAEPIYKGVVFNEMKGATSSVDEVVDMGITALLYPDNCYRFCSGGDPAAIPDLTYEKYLDTYRRFYHPSNARIWLDGAVPLDEVLTLIDEGYLSKFERREEKHDIFPQEVLPAHEMTRYSELAATDSPESKAQLAFGRVLCSWEEKETITAACVLADVLAGTPEAPIKRAMLEAGLGQDVSMIVMEDMYQPYVMVRVHNTNDDQADEIKRVLRETVAALVKNGIDKKSLAATINQLEFQMREPHEPAGLIRNITAMRSWLHGGDPLDYLVWDDTFAALRAYLDTDYYEDLLALIMDEKYLSILHVLPSATIGEERARIEADRVKATVAAMTPDEVDELVEMNRVLADWQQTPDAPEKVATLPVLSLDEVNPQPEDIPTEVTEVNGVTVLVHKLPCKGIVHMNLYFAITDGLLQERALMTRLMGKLPTAKHTAAELQQLIKSVMGNLDFMGGVYAKPGQTAACLPCGVVTCSVLESKLPEAIDLLVEILTSTRYDQPDRIKELVLQADEYNRQRVVMAGNSFANMRTTARFSAKLAAYELVSGYSFVEWLHGVAQDFDARIADLTKVFTATQAETMCRARLTLSVTAAEPVDVSALLSALPEGTLVPADMACAVELPEKEGVAIPAPICFAAMGASLTDAGRTFDGSLNVLANVLTYAWLWNEVRVKGGAYGTGFRATRDNVITAHSYRDPSAANSLAAYRGMADFIREYAASGESIDKSIIAAIGATERLASPRQQGIAADANWFNGVTFDTLCQERRDMLATTPEKLLSWVPMLEKLGQAGAMCVVGGSTILDAVKDEGLDVKSM